MPLIHITRRGRGERMADLRADVCAPPVGGPRAGSEHGPCGSWSSLGFTISKGAVLVAPSSPMLMAPSCAPSLAPASRPAEPVVPEGLLDVLAQVPDPRNPRGVRYRLATLLAIGVCAMTSAGHNSLAAVGEWVRRCDQLVLAALGCPFDPMTGRMRRSSTRSPT
ncbi:transposase family protein [Streptomyces sp. NBC_00201]|uniref:transposase family protein n=1 Tax=Streptomyces sp. NBC_00201 TaxID=2975679 RepID=UPI00338E4891